MILRDIPVISLGIPLPRLCISKAELMSECLKEVLGHENLGTTEIYTHLSSEQMKNAADSNPLAKIKPKKKV